MEIAKKRRYPLSEEDWRLKRIASAEKAKARCKKISAEEWVLRKALSAEKRRYKAIPKEEWDRRKAASAERKKNRHKNLTEYQRILRNESHKKWREKNIEKMRAVGREQHKKHRTRILATKKLYAAKVRDKRRVYQRNREAMKLGRGKLSVDIATRLFALQKGLCPYCHCDLSTAKTHLDHILPLALGGSNTDENVQLLCQPCNQSKHAKHPVDFARQIGLLL